MTTTYSDFQPIEQRAKRFGGQLILTQVDDSVGDGVDLIDMQSASVQISGTFTGSLQVEVQTRDGGAWLPKTLVNNAGNQQATTSGPTILAGDIGARRLRVRRISGTAGTADIDVVAWPMSQANTVATQAVNVGNGSTGPAKPEDSVHSSGDVGMFTLGVRVPAAPNIPTSATTDYSSFAVTAEGKQIMAGTGAEEHVWDACVDLTTTADVALIATAGAGLRRVVTDITLDNTGAAAARVTIKDGTTRRYTRTIPAGTSVDVSLKSPIRGTANTAVQAALTAAGTVTVSISGYIGT